MLDYINNRDISSTENNSFFRAKPKKIYAIQSLRGIAVMLVVLFHLTQLIEANFKFIPFKGFFLFGFSGVHLFFVLSGFIIFMVHFSDIGKPEKYFTYLKKRFIRIYPVYWIILAIISYYMIQVGVVTLPDIYRNIGLLIPPTRYINPVCWTLTYEFFFYIIFSFLILNRKLGTLIVFLWIIGIVVVQVLNVKIAYLYQYMFHKYTTLFLIGIIFSYIVMRCRELKPKTLNIVVYSVLLSGISLFSLTAFYYLANGLKTWDLWSITLGFGLSSGMLMICVLSKTLEDFFKKKVFLSLIGNASYSIYLLHFMFMWWVIQHIKQTFIINNQISIYVLFVAIFALTLLIGSLFYLIIERPLTEVLKKWLLKKNIIKKRILCLENYYPLEN